MASLPMFFLPFEERQPRPSSWLLTHLLVVFLETLPELLDLQGKSRDCTGWWRAVAGGGRGRNQTLCALLPDCVTLDELLDLSGH